MVPRSGLNCPTVLVTTSAAGDVAPRRKSSQRIVNPNGKRNCLNPFIKSLDAQYQFLFFMDTRGCDILGCP